MRDSHAICSGSLTSVPMLMLFLLPDFVARTFGSIVFSDSGELGILILF